MILHNKGEVHLHMIAVHRNLDGSLDENFDGNFDKNLE
jgi:hypothetical protein